MKKYQKNKRKIILLFVVALFLVFSFSAKAEEDASQEISSAPLIQSTETANKNKTIALSTTPTNSDVVTNIPSARPSSMPWYITRSAAITAYILLFFLIVMGENMATGLTYQFITPPHAWLIHKYLGVSFGLALLVHIISLTFDSFLPFGIGDIFLPLNSGYQPVALAFGRVGFYLVLIIMLSSLISRFQRSSWWRKLHFLVYPLFILALLHGLFIGTDSRSIFMLVIYYITGLIFIALLFNRFRLALTRR